MFSRMFTAIVWLLIPFVWISVWKYKNCVMCVVVCAIVWHLKTGAGHANLTRCHSELCLQCIYIGVQFCCCRSCLLTWHVSFCLFLTLSVPHFFWLWQNWVYQSVQHHTGLTHFFSFLTFEHSGTQSGTQSWVPECPNVKKLKRVGKTSMSLSTLKCNRLTSLGLRGLVTVCVFSLKSPIVYIHVSCTAQYAAFHAPESWSLQ